MKSRYALLASILFGILAVVLLKQSMDRRDLARREEEKPVRILVAAEDLREGQVIQEEHLREAGISSKYELKGMAKPDERAVFVGKKLLVNVAKGGFLRAIDVKPKDVEVMISPIKAGERLCTLQVDLYTGVGGRLRPGSVVDVLATIRDDAPGGSDPGAARKSSAGERVLTVLERVKVFSVGPVQVAKTGYSLEPNQYSAVTVVVGPEEAELLVYAASQGRLTLLERSPLDSRTGEADHAGVSRATFEGRLRRVHGGQ